MRPNLRSLRSRSCAPRSRQGELRVVFTRLLPLGLTNGAPPEKALFHLGRDRREERPRLAGNAVGGGQFPACQCGPRQAWAPAANVLDRAEQQMVNGLGVATFAGERV